MLDKIIRLSVENRLAVLIIAAILMLTGMLVTFQSDVDIFPDLNAPTVSIMTEAPGFTPEEVENSITFPIESAINGATGIRRISSASLSGFSVVKAEFDWDTKEMEARQLIAEKLSAVSNNLPDGAEQPVIGPQTSILGEIMLVGLTSDSISLLELRDIADRVIGPRLRALPGIAQVSIMGSGEKQYNVVISPEKLSRIGLTLDEVLSNIESMNSNIPGGNLTDFTRTYSVTAVINTTEPEEMMNVVAAITPDNKIVRLSDIADITVAATLPQMGAASVKGESGILLTIVKQHGSSTKKLTDEVENTIDNFIISYDGRIQADTHLFRQQAFIDSAISNLRISLFEGSIFVIIVLFIFLANVRTTVISIIAIPFSVIVTLLILELLGISVNTMTLGGIAIAIGSLVDDAIVDVENVYRRLRENRMTQTEKRESVIEVVRRASGEVRLPILNSSLVIISSFLPLFFLDGIEGRMLIPLGIAFIVSLAASTLVALTLTPALCVYLLGNSKAVDNEDSEPKLTIRLKNTYRTVLKKSLKHKIAMLSIMAALLVGAGAVMFTFGRNFLPPFNEGSLTINISAPAGTSLTDSERIGLMAEEIIMKHHGVRSTARKTGRAELDEHSRGLNASEIEVAFDDDITTEERRIISDKIRKSLALLPGCVIEVGQPISHRLNAMLSGSEGQIAVKIYGSDLNQINEIGKKVKAEMAETEGLVDITLPPVAESPRIEIIPRNGILTSYGVTPARFSSIFNTSLNGVKVGDVRENGFTYDIIARYGTLHDQDRQIEYLKDLPVDTRDGKVPLSMLADIRSTMGPDAIYRENLGRQIVVSANVSGRDLRSAVNELSEKVNAEIDLPQDYYIEFGGMFESEERSSRTLLLTSLGALLLIIFILYREYHALSEILIILVNIPLALSGGVFFLRITGSDLDIPAIIGFIALMGISTRNGMLLMSRYQRLTQSGMPLSERVITGSSERLLPIIMTALTSALALIPLALRGNEPGNEIQSPMAIVILGGLLTSTILNIFIVPILYTLTEIRKQKIKK